MCTTTTAAATTTTALAAPAALRTGRIISARRGTLARQLLSIGIGETVVCTTFQIVELEGKAAVSMMPSSTAAQTEGIFRVLEFLGMSRRVMLGAAGACAVGELVSTNKAVDTHALARRLLATTATSRGRGAGLLLGGAKLLLELLKLSLDSIHIDAHGTNRDTGAGRNIGTQDMAHAAQVQGQIILGEGKLLVLEVGVLEIDLGPKTAGPLRTHKHPEEINVGTCLAKLGAGEQEGMSANVIANIRFPLEEGALLAIKLERIEMIAVGLA